MSKPLRPKQARTLGDSDLGDSEGEYNGARGGGGYRSEADTWVEEGYLSDRKDEVNMGQQMQGLKVRSYSDEKGGGLGHEEDGDARETWY